MTLQLIEHQPDRLHFAFHSKEREHIQTLIIRANNLLNAILNKNATKQERNEYHAIKWLLKEVCAIDNDNLIKVNHEDAISNDR